MIAGSTFCGNWSKKRVNFGGMAIKYHFTRNQAWLLGAIGTLLVALFGPGTTFGHYDLATVVPLIVGIAAQVNQRFLAQPLKPGSAAAQVNDVETAVKTILNAVIAVKKIQSAIGEVSDSLPDDPSALINPPFGFGPKK